MFDACEGLVPVLCRCCSYYTGQFFMSARKAFRYGMNIALTSSNGSRGGARGAGAHPLIFRPNWDPKSQKNLFWRPPFPLSKGLDPAMISDGEGKELRTLQKPALLSRSNITGSDTFVKTSFLLTYIICNSQNLCYCNLDSYSPSKKHNTLCRLKNRTDFFFQINRSVQNFTCLGNQSDAWWLVKSCYYKNHYPIRKTTAQNWYPVSPEVPE